MLKNMADFCNRDSELDVYCNYPETSKIRKDLDSCSENSSISSFTVSSILPSLNSAVSDPSSQVYIFQDHNESSSLCNYYKYSVDNETSLIDASSEVDEDLTLETTSKDDLNRSKSETSFSSNSQEESNLFQESVFAIPQIQPLDPHLEGWLKYTKDQDPWNSQYYTLAEDEIICCDGILTHEMVSECSSMMGQLPDIKSFVFTRLHINKKGLEDISVLSKYYYFLYVDVSWNYLSDLKALNNLKYLMYINASHNKLNTVLEIQPPWFLTHANLSCNQIKQIGSNLSNFWSLSYLDLSYNLIEKMEGLGELRYLRYLNISHNHIRILENLDCFNIEELNLEFNEISECDLNGIETNTMRKIRILNLSNNKISCLLPFEGLYSLKTFDLHNNNIKDLHEISCLAGLRKLNELNLTKNFVCSSKSYREFVVFQILSLRLLDFTEVKCSERVAAKMLFAPDLFSKVHHLRTKIELWNQLFPQEIHCETLPFDQSPVPIIVLVGPFANNKEVIAENLMLKFPNQIYRFKKYCTIPSNLNYDLDRANLTSVSIDQFNEMIKGGKFLFHYREIGFSFGVSRDELCNCIIGSQIGLIDTTLEAAMILKMSGLSPLMILTVSDDIESYSDRLRCQFMSLELLNCEDPNVFEESGETGKPCISSSKSQSTFSLEKHQFCQEQLGSLSSADCEVTHENASKSTSAEGPLPTITSNEVLEYKNTGLGKKITWSLIENSKEVNRSSSDIADKAILTSPKSQTELGDEVKTLLETVKDKAKTSQVEENNLNEKHLMKTDYQEYLSESLPSQSECSESRETHNGELESKLSSQSFEWVWTYEPSTVSESEPDENYLTMIRGREKFVRNMLSQQELYIETNNLQPGLFVATVLTEDVQSALEKIRKTCYEILKTRQDYQHIEDLRKEPSCAEFINERVSSLTKNFHNFSANTDL